MSRVRDRPAAIEAVRPMLVIEHMRDVNVALFGQVGYHPAIELRGPILRYFLPGGCEVTSKVTRVRYP